MSRKEKEEEKRRELNKMREEARARRAAEAVSESHRVLGAFTGRYLGVEGQL